MNSFFRQLYQMHDENYLQDYIFEVKDCKIRIHKIVLAAASRSFKVKIELYCN